jgi:uncharacterized membrane protein YccF (DUF307 family)
MAIWTWPTAHRGDGMLGGTLIEHKSGPNLLIRFIWWLFVGWWASGVVMIGAWISLVTIIGIPLGIWLINRLPSVLTLRSRTRAWVLGQDADGRTVVTSVAREQTSWPVRGLWFVLIGWWASALWMALAWFIQLTVIGLPIALLMLNRTPFIASLYRY